MIQTLQKFSFFSLRSKLLFIFLMISLLPLGWMTFISYEFAKTTFLKQAQGSLENLGLKQSQLIENFFHDKELHTISLGKHIVVIDAMRHFNETIQMFGTQSIEYQDLEKTLKPSLLIRSEILGFTNFLLVNLQGQVVFSTQSSKQIGDNLLVSPPPPLPFLKDIFLQARDLLDTSSSNMIFYADHTPASYFIASPILSENKLSGIVITQVDSAQIYDLLRNQAGLGETGETIIATRINNQLMATLPLRFNADATYLHPISEKSDFGQFILKVLQGNRLIDHVVDYQGKQTLMVGRYFLPNLNWAIITKIDENEILAPTDTLRLLSLIMAITLTGIVTLIAMHVANTITQPILALTKTTRLMTSGDLSQRSTVHSNDEIGRLGQAFNILAERLDAIITQLDQIVALRTDELEHQNIKLEHTVEALQETQSRLVHQENLASLGALTAGIAHEIKNPLNFINNFAEIALQMNADFQDLLKEYHIKPSPEQWDKIQDILNQLTLNLNKIHEHGARANNIIYNMLQHSRAAPGERTPTNLNDLLTEYAALTYHGMRAQDYTFNVKIEKHYDLTLPKVNVVPQEISRVFLNLLNNAYYSVHQKKQELGDAYTPTVRLTTENHGDLVVIKIWDNGKGISKEVFPRLFVPFFTTKPTGEGTGLGLSLSYNIIVQGHAGILFANGEEGEFAEFVIQLPVKLIR